MIRRKLMTAALAAMFAASSLAMPVAAMAEETNQTVEATEGQTVTHDGDVKVENKDDGGYLPSEKKPGVSASGSNAKVTQNGDVSVKNGNGVDATASSSADVKVNGNVSVENGTGVEAGSSSTVNVKGNVSVENSKDGGQATGVYVGTDGGDDKGSVTIDGNVDVKGTGDKDDLQRNDGVAVGNGTVTVNGNVTVTGSDPDTEGALYGVEAYYSDDAWEGESEGHHKDVTVNGNVTVTGKNATGVQSGNDTKDENGEYEGKTKVTVNGNVTSTGKGADGIVVGDGGNVVVKGNVTATGGTAKEDEQNYGVTLSGGTVSVTGNVTSDHIGAYIWLSESQESYLVVDGTLRGGTSAIHIARDPYADSDDDEYDISEEDESSESTEYPSYKLPTILVKKLETGADGKLITADLEENRLEQKTIDAITASIQYIIDADGFDTLNAKTVTVNGVTYTVAKVGDTVNLKPNVPSGYRLTGLDFGSYQTTVTDNGDGTYTVRVVDGGNLVFKANMEKIESGTPATSTTSAKNTSSKKSSSKTSKTSTTSSKSSGKSSGKNSTSSSGSSSSSSKSTSPKTGDNTNATMWVLVFAAALAGIGVTAKKARH